MSGGKTLAKGIVAHSFNADKSQVAIAPNSEKLFIFDTNKKPDNPSKWSLKHTLEGHLLTIVGVDWCHATNSLVTAGQDRNAYVWTEKDGSWEPELVILRINRAATCVRWTADGRKFAVGSGSKEVAVSRYEDTQSFWVAKSLKRHKSTVLSLAWHPNNVFIVTGSSDNKCRIFSAYWSVVDKKSQLAGFEDIFEKKMNKFGELLVEFDCAKGWVESVCWSPSGNNLAFGSHDSSVHFVSLKDDATSASSIKLPGLPFRAIEFLSEDTVVAAGYDKKPYKFTLTDGKWENNGPLDTGKGTKKRSAGSGFSSAMDKFATATSQGKKIRRCHQKHTEHSAPEHDNGYSGLGREKVQHISNGWHGHVLGPLKYVQ